MKYKLSVAVSVGIGIGIWVLVLLRTDTETTTITLPQLFIKNPSSECDAIIGGLKDKVEAGIGLDITSGEIFWEKSSDKPCKIASLTKLMVVLLAMERIREGEHKLSDIVSVTSESAHMGGSQVYLKEGETFQLQELLKSMMIISANDASYLVAQYLGGTAPDFVRQMNNKASSMGLKDTYFSNPTGLPPDKEESHNVSSCMDIAKLAIEVIKYPEVMQWAGRDCDFIRGGEFKLKNWNRLLRSCDFVDGLKTGYYREAGYNIVATSINGKKKVIAIVLGAKTCRIRDKVAKALVDYGLHKSS
jgi:D-alanyl-D-alanine carboxypeptidase (penicillin-binding protein 5/6)